MSSRHSVLEAVLMLGRAKAYELAKALPYSVSTVYYALYRLEAEGFVEADRDYYVPTFKGVLYYVSYKGCNFIATNATRRLINRHYASELNDREICDALEFLSKRMPHSRHILPALLEAVSGAKLSDLPPSVKRLLAIAMAEAGGPIDNVHIGVLIGNIFAGYCKMCGLVVAPCRSIKL